MSNQPFIDPASPMKFNGYQIRDPKAGKVYFSLGPSLGPQIGKFEMIPPHTVKYILPKEFLSCEMIASQAVLTSISAEGISDVRLEEQHFLQGKLLQEFKFDLTFVIPNSTSTWEHMYEPEFKRTTKFISTAMEGPWEVNTKLFIKDTCHMYTKALLCFE